jgi:hypothetical protein
VIITPYHASNLSAFVARAAIDYPAALFFGLRWAMKPRPAKPISIIAQVNGSGHFILGTGRMLISGGYTLAPLVRVEDTTFASPRFLSPNPVSKVRKFAFTLSLGDLSSIKFFCQFETLGHKPLNQVHMFVVDGAERLHNAGVGAYR